MPNTSRTTNEPAKILLVDDRQENLMAMEAILESPDYDIYKAESGLEALKLLLSNDFALIVLDVRMPIMDGFETAALIRRRERTRYIPILFITANQVDESDLLRAQMAGGIDYISQPLRPDVLTKKVALIIAQRRQPADGAAQGRHRSSPGPGYDFAK